MGKIIPLIGKQKSSVGIELGTHSIKMAELTQTRAGFQLVRYGIIEIPPDKKAKTERDIAACSRVISQLLALCTAPSPRRYFSISGPSVSYIRLKLPPLPDKEIMAAIAWEGKKEFHFPLQNARLVYKRLGTAAGDSGAEMNIFVAAAQNTFIDGELALFQAIGIYPDGIDTVPSALQYAVNYGNLGSNDRTIALLDIGAEHTMLAIFKDNTVQFSRDLMIGGNDFTKAFTEPFTHDGKHFALDFDAAQKIKNSYGIPMGAGDTITSEGIPLSRIMFIVRPILERLITETLRSFDFYKAQTKEQSIDRVFLCGGGAGLKNLPEFLSSGLGIRVGIFNPCEHLAVSPELLQDENFMNNRHQLAVAVGLAAGQCRDFNFIPARPGGLDTTDLRRWLPAFFFIVFAFVLFTMYADLNRTVARSREILQMRTAEFATLSVSIEELKELATRRDALKQQLAAFPDISPEQPRFPEIFFELTGMFPESISLKRIIFQQQKSTMPGTSEVRKEFVLKLEGVAIGEEYVAYGLFNQLGDQLNKSKYLHNVSLELSEKILAIAGIGEPGVRFVFKCLLDQAAFM